MAEAPRVGQIVEHHFLWVAEQAAGRHGLAPRQPNRAYDLVEPKFRRSAAGQVKGYGLQVFP